MAGRFRFSFPPRRHQNDPWFRIGTLEVTTTVLVTLVCTLTIFLWAADPVNSRDTGLLRHFVLFPDQVKDGQVWRLVTWPFVSGPDPQFLWTILRIALFWWFGRDLEAQIGRVRFALLLLAVVIVSGLVATGLDVGLLGIRYVELAVFVLYVAEHPGAQFFFGIPGWIIGVVFVGAELLDLVSDRLWELVYVLLVALGTGLLVGRHYGLAEEQAWIPHVKATGGPRAPARSRRRKPRRGEVVVSGPWGGPAPVSSAADQAEVDRLLDKISAVGMDGLTADEKRRLKEASERLRRERG